MANLKVNNYDNLRLRLNMDEYWDFFVNKDSYGFHSNMNLGNLFDRCLLAGIDLSDDECVGPDGWIYSNGDYYWKDFTAIGHTLYNISYVGVDNGLFTYRKDRISNKEFVDLFKNNKYIVANGDYRLKMHAVSGNTLVYDYPLHIENGYAKLNGGFFQGFFMTECEKYQVLPSNFKDGDVYTLEFSLKKCDLEKESEKTLNDTHPDNKGIFFYLGTRAENKWIYQYDEEDVDNLEQCSQLDMGEFVEDSKIDKKTHIIGYFDENVIEYDDRPWALEDYSTFNYYDEELYADDYCDFNDLSDYVEVEVKKKAKLIDESEKHVTINALCCLGAKNSNDSASLKPFFNGCGCPIRYNKNNRLDKQNDSDFVNCYDDFGDDYISGWDGLESEGEYIEPELDLSTFEYLTDNGFKLSEANWYYFYTDNKFLMFDRTKTGKTVSNWVEGTEFMYCGRKNNFKGNLFILMNRTKTGYTVHNIDELRDKDINEYNPYNDVYDNALAFRITDEGAIGYRLLTVDCEKEGRDKTMMVEGYSFDGVIPDCEWFTVHVRMMFLGGDKMKFAFYVNGKLRYITKELPRIRLRKLNDLYDKQEGVPYNISLGGGTQGLCDTVQYNYMLEPSRIYPLEKWFAGTFIGYVSTFRIYGCRLDYSEVGGISKTNGEKLSTITIYK